MNTDHITVNAQSSIRIAGSKILYFDPFKITEEAHDADFIFVTHSHYDHMDPESIRNISKAGTILFAPSSTEKEMREAAGAAELRLIDPGEEQETGGIRVQAVPAYNRLKPFHPKKNRWNGYVVWMDEVSYYVAGDTDAVKELTQISCDVALVPIGGTYTMNAKEAAGLVNAIRPQTAIPTHYGSIVGKMEDAAVFAGHVGEGIQVETRL